MSFRFVTQLIQSVLKWSFIIVSTIMAMLPYILWAIGLSSIGPISGGLFATMQGSAIISGSFMAVIQSLAMGSSLIIIQLVGIFNCVIFAFFTVTKNMLLLMVPRRWIERKKITIDGDV